MSAPIIDTTSWGCGWLVFSISDNTTIVNEGPLGNILDVKSSPDLNNGSIVARNYTDINNWWNGTGGWTSPIINFYCLSSNINNPDISISLPDNTSIILAGDGSSTPFVNGMSVDISAYWTSSFTCKTPYTKLTTTPVDKAQQLGVFTYGNIPGLKKITWNGTTTLAGFDIESCEDLTEINFPNLVSIDPENTQGGYFQVSEMPNLSIFSAPLLTYVAGGINFYDNGFLSSVAFPSLIRLGGKWYSTASPNLQTLSFPSLQQIDAEFDFGGAYALISISAPQLITVATDILGTGCPTLTTIDLSSYIPTNGRKIDFINCALNVTSIELILRRCVLAGVTTCTIDLSGGTNAAYTALSTQGKTDADALHAAGNTITLNGQPW